ncbi:MAG: FecR domain-containing protein [Balneolaceae bacterium]
MNEKNPHIDRNLLVRYLSGDCSGTEIRQVHEWLEEDPDNEEYLLFVFRIMSSPVEESTEWDTAANWNRFREEHLPGVETEHEAIVRKFGRDATRTKKALRKPVAGRVREHSTSLVAGLIILFLIGMGWFSSGSWLQDEGAGPVADASPESSRYDEIATAAGERMRVNLPDGSSVHLNAASLIRIPWDFNRSGSRVIYLQGEAYFDVERSEGQDFIVQTDRSETTVLGTSFRVQEYPGEERSEIAVSSGVVSFRGRAAGESSSAIVTVNQSAALGQNGFLTVADIEEPSAHFGWLNGELHFTNTSLDNVMKRLERWYDVEIQTDPLDPELLELPVTGRYREGQTIQEVLEQIALNLDIHFIRHEDGTRFKLYRQIKTQRN